MKTVAEVYAWWTGVLKELDNVAAKEKATWRQKD